jgi:hypothetical protein
MTDKIAICIPSRDTWKADFGISLTISCLAFCKMTEALDNEIVNLRFCHIKSSLLPESRNNLVKQALDTGCTHVLWLDDDMMIPQETIYNLYKRNVDIVGANCATKVIPSLPTARNNKQHVFTRKDSTGLEEVNRLGTGVLLVKTDVYKNLEFPYFASPEDPDYGNAPIGEDIYFIKKALKKGYKVFVDHDISKNVYHVGDYWYSHQDVVGYGDSDIQRPEDSSK